MPAALDVVRTFIAAVERRDVAAAAALLADDVRYENVPMDPVVGRAEAMAVVEQVLALASDVQWVVTRELVDGNVVVNERVDRFEINGGWIDLPVAGVFEVDGDGRIALWRDYFDLATYMDAVTQRLAG